MKIDNSFKAVFASMMIVSGLAACDKPGIAESAGKKIDQATENVSTSVSNSADKVEKNIAEKGKVAGQAIDDTQLTAKVKASLLNEPGLKSTKITVVTKDGVVTLTGSLTSNSSIDVAGKIASDTDGVKSVENKLKLTK